MLKDGHLPLSPVVSRAIGFLIKRESSAIHTPKNMWHYDHVWQGRVLVRLRAPALITWSLCRHLLFIVPRRVYWC